MPTIRSENGKQVRVTMGDILRGSRRIKVEKAEAAARKRAKSLDKSVEYSAASKPPPPQGQAPKTSSKTAANNSKSASAKVVKVAPAEASASGPVTRSASKPGSNGVSDISEWTADQDARLTRLKRADAAWNDIAVLMGKSVQDLKTRWAELELEKDQNNSMSGGIPTNASGWTSELDAHLKGLKEANVPWKTIAAKIGKTVSEAKARWSVLSVIAEEERDQNEAMGKDEAQVSRQHKRQVSFASPLVMSETGGAQNGKLRKQVLFVDEEFSLDDIVLLNKIASRYEEEKWLRITSRFFDKTGKRITLQQAKSRVAIRE